MTVRRWLLAGAVVVLLAVALVFVRGDGDDDPFAAYCDEVAERRTALGAALAGGEATGLVQALPTFEVLAAEAPDDIADEWAVVLGAVGDLRDALDAAGVDPATYDPERPPATVDDDELQAIRVAAVRLGSDEVRRALAGVDQQARDVCKTPLTL